MNTNHADRRVFNIVGKALGGIVAVAMLLAPLSHALADVTKLTRVSALPLNAAPAIVPGEYVVTPNGYFHPSCVHEVASTDKVLADMSVQHIDGSTTNFGMCAYPRFTQSGEQIEAGANLMPIRQPNRVTHDPSISWDWVEFSETSETSTAVGYMSASWKVPTAPSSVKGQTVYFFPGTQLTTIIQPVLGWNAQSDNAWTLSSWNCCVNGQTTNSTLIPTKAGDTINGLMQGSSCSGSTCSNWKISTTDATTGTSTTLNATPGQAFNWTFGGVMEVYNISTCTQYPASGSVSFTNFVVRNTSQVQFTPSFSPSIASVTPSCGYKVNANATTTTLNWTP